MLTQTSKIINFINRFVTFGNRKDKMIQKRYDDTDKQRTVKREAPKKGKSTEVGMHMNI